jgi:hypothetical protein
LRNNDFCPKCAGAKACRGRKPEQGFMENEPPKGGNEVTELLGSPNNKYKPFFNFIQPFLNNFCLFFILHNVIYTDFT